MAVTVSYLRQREKLMLDDAVRASGHLPRHRRSDSIRGLFLCRPGSIANHLDKVANIPPGGTIDVLREQTTRLASPVGTNLDEATKPL